MLGRDLFTGVEEPGEKTNEGRGHSENRDEPRRQEQDCDVCTSNVEERKEDRRVGMHETACEGPSAQQAVAERKP